jgi:hypothetical protein
MAFASAKIRMTEMRGPRAGLAPRASSGTVSDYAAPDACGRVSPSAGSGALRTAQRGHPSARNGARVMGHLSKRRSPNRGVDSRALPQVTACRSGPIQLSFPYGSREIARRWPDWCRVALLPSNSGCPQRNRKEVERAIPGCPSRDRGGVSTTPLHRLTTWPSPQSWVTLPWGRVGLARRRRAGYVSHQVVGW